MLTRKPPTRDRESERADRLRVLMTPATGVQRGVIRRADAPVQAPVRQVTQKTPGRKQQAIRDSARGEACQVRIVGACNALAETTVWSHWPGLDGDRGMGLKAIDLAGCYCCAACHDVIDGRAPLPPGSSRESVEIDWHRGHLRSLVLLKRKGMV